MEAQASVPFSEEPVEMPLGVQRALDAMRAEPRRDFDLAALAAIAGTSPRTLQRQFRVFLGKAPLAALHDIRMECTRRVLLRASPNEKVTDVASRCGLPHFGRFSIEYRRRFGEKPSETLGRRATFPARRLSRPAVLAFAHDRATVAVVPTDAGAEGEATGRGIADALAHALTRAGIAITTNVRSARYQLVSSYRGDGHRARLTYRLVEAESGRHVWADHIDSANADAFLFEEHVATNVAAAIQPGLRAAEIARAQAKSEADLTAYDLTLKAMPYAMALDGDAAGQALDLLDRAMSIDPDYPLAIALAAWCHAQRLASSCTPPKRTTAAVARSPRGVHRFTGNRADERGLAISLAQRAVSLGGGDVTVLAIASNALTAADELDAAGLIVRKALSLDGSSAWAWTRSGWIDVYAGRPETAIEKLAVALELAPHDPLVSNSFVGLGCAHFAAGRYAGAIHWLERAVAEYPSQAWALRILCPAFVLSGRRPEAERSLAALRRLYPGVTITQAIAGIPLPQTFRDRVGEGLEDLGVPLH